MRATATSLTEGGTETETRLGCNTKFWDRKETVDGGGGEGDTKNEIAQQHEFQN